MVSTGVLFLVICLSLLAVPIGAQDTTTIPCSLDQFVEVQSYNPSIYDSLGDLDEIHKVVNQADILGAGKIICKYGYGDSLEVALSHRHFELSPIEAMLETRDTNGFLVQPAPIDQIQQRCAKAILFTLSTGGAYYPIAYGAGEYNMSAFHDKKFLREMAHYFEKHQISDKLVIGVRPTEGHLDHSDSEEDEPLYVQENYKDTRRSVLRRLAKNEQFGSNTIPTTYSFKKNAQGDVMQRCTTACNNGGGRHENYHQKY